MKRMIKSSQDINYSEKELINIFKDMTSKQPGRRNTWWDKGFRLDYDTYRSTILTLKGDPVLIAHYKYGKNGNQLKTYDYEVVM